MAVLKHQNACKQENELLVTLNLHVISTGAVMEGWILQAPRRCIDQSQSSVSLCGEFCCNPRKQVCQPSVDIMTS